MAALAAAVEETPQHMQALTRAQEVRIARSRLFMELQRDEVDLEVVLGHWAAQGATVHALCERLPWPVGRRRNRQSPRRLTARASQLLAELGISEARTVGQLTDRQRRVLVGAFEFICSLRSIPQPGRRMLPVRVAAGF